MFVYNDYIMYNIPGLYLSIDQTNLLYLPNKVAKYLKID